MKRFLPLSCAIAFVHCLTHAAEFDVRNPAEFKKIVEPGTTIKKVAGDMKFVEGPVWINDDDDGYLVFSDIPANELKKWSNKGGVETFRKPSNNANGNTLDLQGRLITCEHSARRVSITEKDGTVKTLVDSYQGKKLNSPNDVVVKTDGTIWFTDPHYGIKPEQKEQPGNYVYRLDPKTGKLTAVVKDFDMPNGLCFSPDEKKLYVADSGKPRHIRVFDVQADGTLTGGNVFAKIEVGGPDGIRCDAKGRVYSSAGDGVHIFAPDGGLIAKIITPNRPGGDKPETAANLCFGGKKKKTLYITANTSLYSIKLDVKGD
jgi:gluconolactonase